MFDLKFEVRWSYPSKISTPLSSHQLDLVWLVFGIMSEKPNGVYLLDLPNGFGPDNETSSFKNKSKKEEASKLFSINSLHSIDHCVSYPNKNSGSIMAWHGTTHSRDIVLCAQSKRMEEAGGDALAKSRDVKALFRDDQRLHVT